MDCNANALLCKVMHCTDSNDSCAEWARSGECAKNPAYTLKECPNSCGVCGDHTHAKSTHPTRREAERKLLTSRSACADVDRLQCLIWGEHECDVNPLALLQTCPKTCGACTLSCADKSKDCEGWAKANKCESDKLFMHPNCPFSCGICATMDLHKPKDKSEL